MTLEELCAGARERQLDWLREYVRMPSISSSPEHAAEVRRCGEWTVRQMERIGLRNGRLLETGGQPVAYAEWLEAPGAPTALVYGHYDVQPVDPVELWESPPVEPTIRHGELYARGSVDDKGQVLMHWAAVEALFQTAGRLPLNLKFLIEGEEEIGSPNLDAFIDRERDLLRADVAVISD